MKKPEHCSWKVVITADPGTPWGIAVQETEIFCLQNCVNATLTLNGKEYEILQQDLIGCAKEIKT